MSSLRSLPASWLEVELGDVIDYGKTIKVEPTEIPDDAWLLELEDIEKDTSKLLSRVTFAARRSKSTKYRFSKGDVLYGKLRPYLNKVIRANQDGFCTTEIVPLKENATVDGGFLFHWTRHPRFRAYVTNVSHGLNMPRLGTDAGRRAPFVLAPIQEQRRIAHKLDTLLKKVDACRGRLDRVPQILKKFREAVLEAAVSGRLTEEWRASTETSNSNGESVVDLDAAAKRQMLALHPELAKKKSTLESALDTAYMFDIPSTWVFTTWGRMSEWITYGFTRPMPHSDAGHSLITARDVHYFQVATEQAQYTTAKAFGELSDKDRPMYGDLLLTKDGTIGRAALVRSSEPFCINQSVAVVWLRSTSMNKDYLEFVANAGFTQTFIRDKAKGMAIQHLSITDFAQCPLPVPPAEEQAEIVRRVQELFALSESLERRHTDAVLRVAKLTPCILAKAFRGELVPQDPGDEPAQGLLKSIRQRNAIPEKGGQNEGRRIIGRERRAALRGGRGSRASSV